MENLKKMIPLAMLLSFIIKMMIISPGFADMGIVISLVSLVGLLNYIDKKEDIETIKNIVNKQNETIQAAAIEIAKMKTIVEGVRLKNEFKQADIVKRAI